VVSTGTIKRATPSPERRERRAQVVRLFRQLKDLEPGSPGHTALREQLVAEHMNYAYYVASRFNAPVGSEEDLQQVACLALVKAVDGFDPDYGTPFIGYLTPMITGEIKRHFRDTTWDVHVTRPIQELSLKLRDAAEQLTHDLGRAPTVPDLAGHLGVSEEEVVDALDAANAYSAASLDQPAGPDDEGGARVGDFLGEADPGFEAVVNRESLKPLLARLPERDKRILLMRFFRGMTQTQIAEEIGVSQMQVSRLLTRVLNELRQGFGAD
jgi:RNA polymerase sigma-B factor